MLKSVHRTLTAVGAIAALALFSFAPMASAAITPGAKGEGALTSCEAGASGNVKWAPGKFEMQVTIPSYAGQTVGVDARYSNNGTVTRVKPTVTLDARGQGRLKIEPAPAGSLTRVDVAFADAAHTVDILLLTGDAACVEPAAAA